MQADADNVSDLAIKTCGVNPTLDVKECGMTDADVELEENKRGGVSDRWEVKSSRACLRGQSAVNI